MGAVVATAFHSTSFHALWRRAFAVCFLLSHSALYLGRCKLMLEFRTQSSWSGSSAAEVSVNAELPSDLPCYGASHPFSISLPFKLQF